MNATVVLGEVWNEEMNHGIRQREGEGERRQEEEENE